MDGIMQGQMDGEQVGNRRGLLQQHVLWKGG